MCGCGGDAAHPVPGIEERRRLHADGVVLLAPEHPYAVTDSPLAERPCRPNVVMVDDLVARADEFVSIGDDGRALVAKAIRKHLTDQEIEHVEAMVAIHNLKLHDRPPHLLPPPPPAADDTDTGTSSQALDPPAPQPCTPNASISFSWWGFRIHLDHCFCKMIPLFGTAGAGSAASVAAILGLAGISAGPWIGIAAGCIALMAAWITWADGYCTPNSGANYNQSWTVQGWITTNC